MKAHGHVFKYGDNVDTDVIIPARHLAITDPKGLAEHCMEDIDADFIKNVQEGDIIVARKNFGCGSSRETCLRLLLKLPASAVSLLKHLQGFFTEMLSISDFRSLNARMRQEKSKQAMKSISILIRELSGILQKAPNIRGRHFRRLCRN